MGSNFLFGSGESFQHGNLGRGLILEAWARGAGDLAKPWGKGYK